jgi:SAM-dependent methyltransferase
MTNKADYGNWVPRRMIFVCFVVALVVLAVGLVVRLPALKGVLFGVAALASLFLVYLGYAYYSFARYDHRLPRQFYGLVIDQLPWDGAGIALDIGTGNGGVAIELAKRLDSAQVVGVDLWTGVWSYGSNACRSNAAIEGVGNRVRFEPGSATDLPFDDEMFDAAVSNFVFHSVVTDDRVALLREALRVLRKGGAFSFQDLFNDQFYDDPEGLAEELRSWGLADVRFVRSEDHIDVPALLRVKHMVGGAGVLSGVK